MTKVADDVEQSLVADPPVAPAVNADVPVDDEVFF